MALVDGRQPGLFWQSRMGNNADGIGGNCHRYDVVTADGRQACFLVDYGIKLGHNAAGYSCELPSPKGLLARQGAVEVEGGGRPPEALILTHAHEDHLGGIRHAIDMGYEVPPVYASPFTAAMLVNSLVRAGIERRRWPEIRPVAAGDRVSIANAQVEFVPMDHLLGAMGLLVKSDQASVFHTGDYKFDPSLPLGDRADPNRLRAIGREGVDMVVADSTAAAVPGIAVREDEICRNLTKLVADNRGRAVVAGILGSQLDRLVSLGRAAQANGRALVVSGSSLASNVAAARSVGIDIDGCAGTRILTTREGRELPADKVLLVTTGAFAQPNAGLTRAADRLPGALWIDPDTTVIIPQRAIPNVRSGHGRMVFKLEAQGARVVTAERAIEMGYGPIHQSGHAVEGDVLRLYSLLRPKAVVAPVHGDAGQVAANARLAQSLGIPALTLDRNGAVVRVGGGRAEVLGHEQTGRIGAREIHGKVKALPRSPRGEARVPGVPATIYRYDELDPSGRTILATDVHPNTQPTRDVGKGRTGAVINLVLHRGR